MKKLYIEPNTETVCAYAMCSLGVLSGNADGPNALSKSRDDEDEEAYAATDGAGEAAYGDLW